MTARSSAARASGEETSSTASADELCNMAVAFAREVDPGLSAGAPERLHAIQQSVHPVVAVVGEVKKGKSSLINALVGVPGLSPVDVTVTTATYVTLRHGDRPRALVHPVDEAEPYEVTPAAAGQYIGPTSAHEVARVDLTVHAPWLGGAVLLDTPGMGGLVSAHTDIAVRAAEDATALIFVTSAAAPFSSRELAFLSRIASTVENVVFVLSKTGKHPGWQDVLQENREHLKVVAPRFKAAPWVPVDSVFAETALELRHGRHPAAHGADTGVDDLGLWAESGFGRLLDLLSERILVNSAGLATANALRFARTIAEGALRALEAELQTLGPDRDHDAKAALSAEKEKLRRLNEERRAWAAQLEYQISRIRNDVNDELATAVTEMREGWVRRFDEMRRAPSATAREGLLDEIDLEALRLGERVLTQLRRRLMAAAQVLVVDLDDNESVLPVPAQREAMTPRADVNRRPRPNAQELLNGAFRSTTVGGAAGGLALSLGLGTALMLPVGLAAGVVGLGVNLWVQRDAARKRDIGQAVQLWIHGLKGRLERRVQNEIIETRLTLHQLYHDSCTRREATIAGQTRHLQQSIMPQARREELAKRAKWHRQRMLKLRSEIDKALGG